MPATPVLREGRTCWRLVRAERVAFLVDGESYFAAVADAIENAERSVWIIGWDLNTRVRLRRREDGGDGSDRLADLLLAALRRRRRLRVRILEWDFAIIYAVERELLPLLTSKLGIKTHRRLHFRTDNQHPVGASHHQKIVVVDDRVAFSGGLDLTHCRWDTPQHLAEDERRSDPGYPEYAPFHDVQMCVDGEAAAALGELARKRWQRATGQELGVLRVKSDPWPSEVVPDLRDARVGIARTDPVGDGGGEIREVENLYVEAIRAARRFLYFENQYLTAHRVADALVERLAESDGPEVVIVGPRLCSGWLEQNTMGVLRDRFLGRLRAADRHGRLRAYYPAAPGLGDRGVFVHAKICIADDRLLRIGSANLANRSMGLDTECDLAIEADAEHVAEAIAAFRDRLLGEHLGVAPQRVGATIAERGSLVAAIESLRGNERTLELLPEETPEWLDRLIPQQAVLDPERPVDFEELAGQVLPPEPPDVHSRNLRKGLAVGAFCIIAAVAWAVTPLGEAARPEQIADRVSWLRESSLGPLVAVLGFVLGGIALVPLVAMIVASALVFGPTRGFAVSFAGALASGVLSYTVGRALWRDAVRRLAGERLNRLSRRIARRGALAVAGARLIPLGPYTIVNLVAGASHVRFRDFLLGTSIGLLPGILGLTVFADRTWTVVTEGGWGNVLALAGVLAVFAAAILWLRRRGQREGTDLEVQRSTEEHG